MKEVSLCIRMDYVFVISEMVIHFTLVIICNKQLSTSGISGLFGMEFFYIDNSGYDQYFFIMLIYFWLFLVVISHLDVSLSFRLIRKYF